MHECYNPYGGRIVKLNKDLSGVIESNFSDKKTFSFIFGNVFGNPEKLKEGVAITFTLNLERKIACVYIGGRA